MATLTRERAETIFNKLEVPSTYSTNFVSGPVRMNGAIVTMLHYSNGNSDMSDHVYHRLRRALHLTPEEFHELWGCTMSKQRYFGLLSSRLDAGHDPG